MMNVRPKRVRDLPEVTHLVRDRARSLGSLCSTLSTASQCIEKYKSEAECWWDRGKEIEQGELKGIRKAS